VIFQARVFEFVAAFVAADAIRGVIPNDGGLKTAATKSTTGDGEASLA
jgi:hypothetical protein